MKIRIAYVHVTSLLLSCFKKHSFQARKYTEQILKFGGVAASYPARQKFFRRLLCDSKHVTFLQILVIARWFLLFTYDVTVVP